jgi:uncharacterized protein YcbX
MHVTSLHIYPIKGCRGYTVASAPVERLGIAGDRRLMLVDESGRFLSQREEPVLATLEPRLSDGTLEVHAAGRNPLVHAIDPHGVEREVSVWESTLVAHDQGDIAAQWFSAVTESPCRLVAFGAASERALNPRWVKRPGTGTAFADAYPVLAVLQESLDDLNTRLARAVPMARFRPNIVVAGTTAWSEDGWQGMQIGVTTWDAVKPCDRCVVTMIDQLTGQRDPQQEPLRTLATFRTVPGLGTLFGQNLVPRDFGTVHSGDEVMLT